MSSNLLVECPEILLAREKQEAKKEAAKEEITPKSDKSQVSITIFFYFSLNLFLKHKNKTLLVKSCSSHCFQIVYKYFFECKNRATSCDLLNNCTLP